MSLLWAAHWYCKVCRRCAPGMPSSSRDFFLSQGLGQNLGASFCVLKRLLIFVKYLLIFVKRLLFFVKRLLIFGGILVAYGRHTFCSGVPPITYCVLVGCVKSGTGGTPFYVFIIDILISAVLKALLSPIKNPHLGDCVYRENAVTLSPDIV